MRSDRVEQDEQWPAGGKQPSLGELAAEEPSLRANRPRSPWSADQQGRLSWSREGLHRHRARSPGGGRRPVGTHHPAEDAAARARSTRRRPPSRGAWSGEARAKKGLATRSSSGRWSTAWRRWVRRDDGEGAPRRLA